MSILDHRSVFSTMLQKGPFAVLDEPPLCHPFSKETKAWVASIKDDQIIKTKYRAVRNQIFDLLDIRSFDEVLTLIHEPERRRKTIARGHQLLANMFAIATDSERETERYLSEYARTADDVIHSLRAKVLSPYAGHLGITNEIESTNDPILLLLYFFDDRFHKKARFEAKRKLALLNLAGSIDQRERETGIADKFSDFINFLNMYVWSPRLKIGDLETTYLLSNHEPGDFKCVDVETISAEKANLLDLRPGQKLTLIKRRLFDYNGSEIPIYVTIRKKPPAAKVLKLLRKNEKNPATAVDDDLGLMAVLDSINDVKCFLRHLTRCAAKADSLMTLEDISDTLTGGEYGGKATGSSSKTSMLKFFARLGGMRVEFIIHTNRSYLNYLYQRDVAHDEYEVKRIFDSGVAEFLFPKEIYNMDLTAIREKQLARFRREIEAV